MKRILSILLASALCFVLLCSCVAKDSSTSTGTPSQEPDASSEAPLKTYTGGTAYFLNGNGSHTEALYELPKADSPLLQNAIRRFIALETVGEWTYGICGNWFGWVPNTSLENVNPTVIYPFFLPEFLTGEQQRLFMRATEMFNAYICTNEGLALDISKPVTYNDDGWIAHQDKAFSNYESFEIALNSLFTPEYLASNIDPGWGPFYMNIDEKLYIIDGGRGAWSCLAEGYTLQEQSDTRISFLVNFVYTTPLSDYRCSLPVEMVNTSDGWRFSQFTSEFDDLRWMDELGPDFNPWEGQE